MYWPVEPFELFLVEDCAGLLDALEREFLDELRPWCKLFVRVGMPAEEREVVDDGFGRRKPLVRYSETGTAPLRLEAWRGRRLEGAGYGRNAGIGAPKASYMRMWRGGVSRYGLRRE